MTDDEKADAMLKALMEPLAKIIATLEAIRDGIHEMNNTLNDVTANRREWHVRES